MNEDQILNLIKEVRAEHWNSDKPFDVEVDIILTNLIKRIELE